MWKTGYSTDGIFGVVALCADIDNTTASTSVALPMRNMHAMITTDKTAVTLLPRGALGELCFAGDQIVRASNALLTQCNGS